MTTAPQFRLFPLRPLTFALALCCGLAGTAGAVPTDPLTLNALQPDSLSALPPAFGEHGMAVSAPSPASETGAPTLAKGGTAPAAPAAQGYPLALVHPSAGRPARGSAGTA